MRAFELLSIYGLLGLAVAAAWHRLRGADGLLMSVLFWPLYLPFLMRPGPECAAPAPTPMAAAPGTLGAALAQTRHRLDTALAGTGGAESVGVAPVLTRVPELLGALEQQAREADALEAAVEEARRLEASPELDEALAEARRRTRQRLSALHEGRRDELRRALLRLEELAGMVQLARFAAGERAHPAMLSQQIHATVQALADQVSEAIEGETIEGVAWRAAAAEPADTSLRGGS